MAAIVATVPATAHEGVGAPDIRSFSGSPLMLQVVLTDPLQEVTALSLSSDTSTLTYRIPEGLPREELIMHMSPFFGPGVYDLEILLETGGSETKTTRFQVGFVDFVWGRDNLSFGNNDQYQSVIGTFGEVLSDWVRARFGEITETDLVLLVDYMYSLFGTNTGRCYAFAGTEVRYWRWPDLLPSYYDTLHDLRGTVARHQREMNYLQFDLVFEHFVAREGYERLWRPLTHEEILDQALRIESSIAAHMPVAVGFGGPGFHHSMLVFGYIHNPARETIDLLVANNWKSDEKLNIHSEDAEMVRLFLAEDQEAPRIEWRYEGGLRTSIIDRLMVLDVQRDPYVHDRGCLDALVEQLRERLHAEQRTVIVVEEVAGARLVGGDRSSGRMGRREIREIDEVWFEYLGRVFRFTHPAGSNLELEIADDTGARVLAVVPGDAPGLESGRLSRTEVPPTGSTVTRRVPLR